MLTSAPQAVQPAEIEGREEQRAVRRCFSFVNFLGDVLAVFLFVLWFWLLITVIGDLFRRRDISGAGKIPWLFQLILLPYIASFAYLLTQSGRMAERAEVRTRDELRQIVGFRAADEIDKLRNLKAKRAISGQYAKIRARLAL
jgi:hypothetical protein